MFKYISAKHYQKKEGRQKTCRENYQNLPEEKKSK